MTSGPGLPPVQVGMLTASVTRPDDRRSPCEATPGNREQMPDYRSTVASFVPNAIVERVLAHSAPVEEAGEAVMEAGVLFADISGFTALTGRLSRAGPEGAEALTRILNPYFGAIIDPVLASGGDVLKFAGDALLAVWPVGDGGLAERIACITAVSVALQRDLHEREVAPGIQLSMKLAIGAGTVKIEHLGGVFDRWEFLVSGSPLAQLGRANDAAGPGDIVFADEAAALLDADIATERAAEGVRRLRKGASAAEDMALPALPDLAEADAEQLLAFLPAAIRGRVAAGYADWLCELRDVSVVFMNLPGLNVDTPLDKSQQAMRGLQAALYRYEGSINKMSVDDKGVSLIAVLGLPPLSHTDDPERAVRAAGDMQAVMAGMNLDSSIGVCTGRAFCGVVGNDRRREYTVMGDLVNLSARLMQAAAGGILVDARTADASAGRLAFDDPGSIMVKGRAEPVEVRVPRGNVAPLLAVDDAAELLGRDSEGVQLAALLDAIFAGRTICAGVVAEGGFGKWAMVADLLGRAAQTGVETVVISGDRVDSVSPYLALRLPLRHLLGLGKWSEGDSLPDVLHGLEVVQQALLADLLGVRLVRDADAVLPEGEALQTATRELVASLLIARGGGAPLLIAVRDWHLLDEGSRGLLEHLLDHVPGLGLVATLRAADADSRPPWWSREDTLRVTLGPLTDDVIVEIARRHLQCERLAPDLADLFVARAGGNPMFCEELVTSLRALDGVRVHDGRASLAPGATDDVRHVPPSLHGMLAARIDRLDADAQMTLKVASVAGNPFALDLVAELHPHSPAPRALAGEMRALVEAELVTPVSIGTQAAFGRPPFYAFRKPLVRDIAYDLMLFSQRRALHQRLAEWIESHLADELAPHYATLGRHWAAAAAGATVDRTMAERAATCLQRAGDRAVRSFANADAAELYREAIHVLVSLPDDSARDDRELDLLLALGNALVSSRSYADPEVARVYDRAREIGEHVGRHRALFGAIRGLWQAAIGRSDYVAATLLAGQLVELADAEDDASLAIEAHRAVGNSAFWPGDFETARHSMETAATLMADAPDAPLPEGFSQDPDIANRALLAWTLASLGWCEGSMAQLDAAVQRGEALQHPFSLAYAHGAGMWTGFVLRDSSLAGKHADVAAGISESAGIPYFLVAARVVQGWVRAVSGDADAVVALDDVLSDWREASGGIGMALFLYARAEARFAVGQPAAAMESLRDPLLTNRVRDERWYLADVRRLESQCLWALGQRDESSVALREARRIATDQRARLAALRIACFEVSARRPDGDCAALDAALHALPQSHPAGTVAEARQLLAANS